MKDIPFSPGMLVLASASPRRHKLLQLAGVPHRVIVSDVEEPHPQGADPHELTRQTAILKAQAVLARCAADTWVLAADTNVVIEGEVLGKPSDAADARRMLRALSGRDHQVMTAVVLGCAGHDEHHSFVETTQVYFRTLDENLITGYVSTGEPMDKAGAYGIQGKGALLVRSIEGSYTNVVGLPLCETVQLIQEHCRWRPFSGGGEA